MIYIKLFSLERKLNDRHDGGGGGDVDGVGMNGMRDMCMLNEVEFDYTWPSSFEQKSLMFVWLLTLKRPGLCGWLRPTQFKPRLDWVGSAAQVRRYRVDSAAQAFIHALAGCVPRTLQYALCGPRNSRPAHFAAHALDVLATYESPNLTQLST